MNQPLNIAPNPEQSKLLWRCRRGLLELDLLLIPFIENRFEQLSSAELALFQTLLGEDDVCIKDWLSGHERPASRELRELIGKIIVHAHSK